MLRLGVARSSASLEHGLRTAVRRQWQPQRSQALSTAVRRFAEDKQGAVAGVPTGPIQATATANPAKNATSTSSAPSGPSTALPSPGGSTISTPPPKPPRRRFRSFLYTLIILSALGYAGGVYYSLVNDNFHDFFTEYVPFGEDAVAYFEEREFRRRFPSARDSSVGPRLHPQRTGEQKVTIGKQSGLTAKVAKEEENIGSDLGSRGKHVSAKEDNKRKTADQGKPSAPASSKDAAPTTQAKIPDAKALPKQDAEKSATTGATKPTGPEKAAGKTEEAKPASPIEPVDHLSVPDASEPAVQNVVAFINRLITVINASPDMIRHRALFAQEEINKIISGVTELKARASSDAENKIQQAHTEFDEAAQELVKRLEREMQDQELKWREEYESEREKLSESYRQKLALELDSAKKLAEQKTQTSLLEQEIALQKQFLASVQNSVEEERNGRLAKLDDLSSSVSELQDLTTQWNSVVDATLATQHLQVALEAVRAKVLDSETSTPFLNELVALKETSSDSPLVSAAIASIPPQAYQRGIPTPADLIDRFRRVASEVRKASLLPEDAGVASHAASAVLSRLMFAKKADRGLPAGEDVEATLARTEVLLEEGDLDSAAREMNALKGWAGVLSRDWVAETRRVLEVRQAVDVIAVEARLQSLLVD